VKRQKRNFVGIFKSNYSAYIIIILLLNNLWAMVIMGWIGIQEALIKFLRSAEECTEIDKKE
jgi:hypothetical protein